VLRRAQQDLGEEEVVPEILVRQLEAISRVCHTLAEVRAKILRLRRGVAEAAKEGGRIAIPGTHPFLDWREQPITPKQRYKNVVEYYQRLIQEQLAFGFHVHVGLEDREAAVQVMNRARLARADARALGQLPLLARCRCRLRQLPHAGLG
jgi:carboxylate-amine ligase